MKASPDQTVAFGAKCNHKSDLDRRHATRFGHTVWAHFWAHTARFSLNRFGKRKEKATRRRFFEPLPQGTNTFNRAIACAGA
jgi:hypothetical protein